MVIPMLNAEHGYFTPALTLLASALALQLGGCANFGGGVDDLIDESPIPDIEFSLQDEVAYQGAATFDRRVYGSLGGGISQLTPNTEQAEGIDVADENDPGTQVAAGVDLSKTFSVELHATDLGSARLSPSGRIGYQVGGGSVLMYAGKQRAERRGLMGYGRAGVASTSVEAIDRVNLSSDGAAQGLLGAGLEYMGRNVGLRGEVIVFDKDAQFAQLGVIYRLGGSGADTEELPDLPATGNSPFITPAPADPVTAPAPPTAEPPLPETPVVPAPPPPQPTRSIPTVVDTPADIGPIVLPAPLPEIADNDADGIPDDLDNCPASDAGIEVDDSGCAVFNGVVDGVNFERGSAQLTAEARTRLDSVIRTLRQHPDALVSIAAHTDGRGREEDNLALSRDRAITVARYLITRGVPKALMSARAFGEYQPIADNETPEGRALNRRVEIVASKSAAK